jgi:hypothetical protein
MTRQLKHLAGLTAIAGALVLLGSGCGDKREMSKQNFAHVLNEDYSANADCLFTKPIPYPFEMQTSDTLLGDVHKKLDALTAAGLLTRTSHDGNLRYELTLTGQQVPGNGRFCYGKRQVTSVDNYSNPTEFHGNRFTKVEYHFVEKGSPDWAKVNAIQTAFPAVAKAVAGEPVDKATLVLTDDGWVRNED